MTCTVAVLCEGKSYISGSQYMTFSLSILPGLSVHWYLDEHNTPLQNGGHVEKIIRVLDSTCTGPMSDALKRNCKIVMILIVDHDHKAITFPSYLSNCATTAAPTLSAMT